MKQVDIFRVPVYEFINREHAYYKDAWLNYIRGNHQFIEYESINYTHPNLHKEALFRPFTEFLKLSMKQMLQDIDLDWNFGITSMWGTYQTIQGKHSSHTHGNNLWAGVYYLHADRPSESGTVFENVAADYNPIKLKRQTHSSIHNNETTPMRSSFFDNLHKVKFEEGKLVLFPAWLRHRTYPYHGRERAIIGANMMPIGLTNTDPYDRYDYQDFSDRQMLGDGIIQWKSSK